MTDVAKSTIDGADEVIGDNWPTDSATEVADAAEQQRHIAGAMDEAARAAADGKAYASHEMEGAAAEALAAKYGYHMGKFADRTQAHLYTAGWLSMLAMAITSTKNAMNAAVAMHSPDHAGPVTEFHTQTQKDQSLHTAQQAVQAAKENLEHVKSAVATGISTGQKPPMVPALGSGGKPTTKPPDQAPRTLPPTDPTAPNPYSPENTNPGLNNPGGPAATPAPAAPVSPLGGSPGKAPAASLPPPTLNDLPGGAGSGLGGPGTGSGSPFGGSPMGGMPMGGMPMGGMPPMQPPQMPQLPTQTPGNDIAKTVGDTVGKLAGAHNSQPISSDTLGKLLDAQHDGGAGAGGLGDDKGTVVKNDDGTLVNDDKNGHGLKPHSPGLGGPAGGPTDPYSAENRNPSLNNPAAPQVTGPPSPAAPTVTPTPPVHSAPMTELSADDSGPPPPAAHTTTAATAGDPGQAHAANGTSNPGYTAAPAGGPNSAQPAGQSQGQQQQGVGGALGAYPGGAGFAPLPPAPVSPAMMGGGAAIPAAAASAAAVGTAATPVIVPAKSATSSSNGGGSLAADPAAAAAVERITVLPPEHAVAHEHLAGVLKALRDRPGIAWTSARAAIGVFLYEEPGLPSLRVRYILATTDGLSLIPMDVKVPAGLELLSAVIDPAGSFASDWGGHERPGLKLAAAADAYPNVLGQLDYLVSNDTEAGVLAPAKASGVTEAVQTATQFASLIATRKASPATMPRVNAAAPHIPPSRAAEALDAFGHAWRFDDGSPDDLKEATTRLWAARWGVGKRRLERPDDYVGTLATYWYVEGRVAVAAGRLDDAAYAAHQLAMLNPATVR